MKVLIIRCKNPNLWYSKKRFPIETTVMEAEEFFNSQSPEAKINSGNFINMYDLKDFYYSKELTGYIAKEDCANNEEEDDDDAKLEKKMNETKKGFCYQYKSQPWNTNPLKKMLDKQGHILYGELHKSELNTPKEETKKFDEGKPCFSDIPQLTLMSVAKVFNYGANKYSKFNYSAGTNWLRYYDACQRHLHSWMINENIDESKHHHLDHAIASLMMLRENIHLNKGTDNRNQIYNK